jgi:hypothetical protein
MFARGLLSFHPAPLPGSKQNLLSPIIPTLALLSCKSNHCYHVQDTGGRGTGPTNCVRSDRAYKIARLRGRPLHRPYNEGRQWAAGDAFHFRGQTNVIAAGGRSVLQRYLSLRGAAASIVASNCWAWSNGRETRKKSARRAWAYFS